MFLNIYKLTFILFLQNLLLVKICWAHFGIEENEMIKVRYFIGTQKTAAGDGNYITCKVRTNHMIEDIWENMKVWRELYGLPEEISEDEIDSLDNQTDRDLFRQIYNFINNDHNFDPPRPPSQQNPDVFTQVSQNILNLFTGFVPEKGKAIKDIGFSERKPRKKAISLDFMRDKLRVGKENAHIPETKNLKEEAQQTKSILGTDNKPSPPNQMKNKEEVYFLKTPTPQVHASNRPELKDTAYATTNHSRTLINPSKKALLSQPSGTYLHALFSDLNESVSAAIIRLISLKSEEMTLFSALILSLILFTQENLFTINLLPPSFRRRSQKPAYS